jgi:hypothetical protein
MASKLKLYQEACRSLRQTPVDTVTDDIFIRYELDRVYDDTLQECLEEGLWNFAMRSVAIEHSESVTPSFGFSYAFEKPDDWVRTSVISGNGTLWPPVGAEGYEDETSNWHADYDPLYVSYVSNDASYGLDLSMWPETFALYVGCRLGLRVGPTVTGFSKEDEAALEKKCMSRLKNARSKDAMNQATKSLPPGRLVTARRGGLGRHYDYRQNG